MSINIKTVYRLVIFFSLSFSAWIFSNPTRVKAFGNQCLLACAHEYETCIHGCVGNPATDCQQVCLDEHAACVADCVN
jgi:hypothetical protein